MSLLSRIIYFVVFILVLPNVSSVYGQEASPSQTPTPTPVEYQLPYPGILPGHPFYFLKNIRDNIVGFFISNPLKRAEFDLLQADKNFAASELLFSQKKDIRLIFQTLSSAEAYFNDAIRKALEAKNQGINTVDFTVKITIANLKHQELVLNLSKSAKGDDKKKFKIELKRIMNLGEKVKILTLR